MKFTPNPDVSRFRATGDSEISSFIHDPAYPVLDAFSLTRQSVYLEIFEIREKIVKDDVTPARGTMPPDLRPTLDDLRLKKFVFLLNYSIRLEHTDISVGSSSYFNFETIRFRNSQDPFRN